MTIKIAINGASGRMGQAIKEAIKSDTKSILVEEFTLEYRLNNNSKEIDVIIDFSSNEGTLRLLEEISSTNQKPLLIIGTTGLTESTFDKLKEYGATKNGIIWGSNTSFGVNLMFAMVKKMGAILGTEYDAEIYERHHRYKKDSPSGTAITIGKKIAEGRKMPYNQDFGNRIERKDGDIGFAVERGGKTVGYHEASFLSDNERIWFGHEAFDRSIFANGALKLAQIAIEQNIKGYNEASDVLEKLLSM